MQKRRTISSAVEITGRGVHSGEMGTLRLLPADAGNGITFRRKDLGGACIAASIENLVSDQLLRRTTLQAGDAKVYTIEHVLSAAAGLQVSDMVVEMDCAEPPFIDGSSLPYVELIRSAGISELPDIAPAITITHAITFRDSSAEFVALPSAQFRISFFFSSEHPNLRRQSASIVLTPESYTAQIAPARTFCFFEEIEAMRRQNLIKGANLGSAVVIGRKGILNDSLRFADEPVRHKILDFIGDLALLGGALKGHFLVWRSGHRANAAFAQYLKKEFPCE